MIEQVDFMRWAYRRRCSGFGPFRLILQQQKAGSREPSNTACLVS
jgi:hypothetical protein